MISIIVILLSISIFSVEYKNTENSITLLTNSTNYFLSDSLYNNLKVLTADQKWFDHNSNFDGIIFNNLKPNTKYYLYNKKELKLEHEVFTLAIEPEENHFQITGLKAEPGKIEVIVNAIDNVNTLILASRNHEFSDPEDGYPYESNDKVKVVFQGIANKAVSTENLEYGQYKVKAYTYNGNGRSINYNLTEENNNPRLFYPQLFPPVAKSVIGMEENVYQIEWEQVEGAIYYELQVSDSNDFKVLHQEYQNADVGNGNKFDIYIDDISKGVYWRIRAVGKGGRSDFSNILSITEKK